MRFLKPLKFLFFCVVAVLVSCSTHVTDPNSKTYKNARALFEVGKGQYEDRKYPAAIYSLQQSLSYAPDQTDAEIYLALSLMEMEKFAEAEAIYNRICPTLPENGACLNNHAALKLKMKQPDAAFDLAARALAQNTYTTPELALGNQAKARMSQGRTAEAIVLLDRAQRIQPRNCGVRVLKTQVLLRGKRFEDGLQNAKLTTLQCPISPVAQAWEAYALYRIGRHPQARDKLEWVMNEFRGSEVSEYAVKSLEKIPEQIALEEPPL